MRIKPLPPLNSLVSFEASARHLSFTKASHELNVTQGAISRSIKHLESYLGCILFLRDNKTLKLTASGQQYYDRIFSPLQQISQATADILKWEEDQRVTVITSNAMASFWLFPRIADFEERYPEVDLRIVAIDSMSNVRRGEYDIAMFYCKNIPKGMTATPLFNETVFPVCSPSYLKKLPAINNVEDLLQTRLLSLEIDEEWVSWKEWFEQFNLGQRSEKAKRIAINNYLLVIQAALNGQGVALGWENLVDEYLDSGLLVKATQEKLVTSAQFYMLEPDNMATTKTGVECFRNWLLASL